MFVPPERTARYTLLAASERAGVLCLLPCCWLACLVLDDICLTLLWPDGSSTMESQVWICTLSEDEEEAKWKRPCPLCSIACLVARESSSCFYSSSTADFILLLWFFFFFLLFSSTAALGVLGWLSLCSSIWRISALYLIASTSRARRTNQPDRWLDAGLALGPSRALQDKTGPLDPSA